MKTASADRSGFIAYPTNRVVGTIGDEDKARAAIDALLRAGFDREDIDILKLAGNLHVDAVVPGDDLRSELQRRFEAMDAKAVPGYSRRRPVLPV